MKLLTSSKGNSSGLLGITNATLMAGQVISLKNHISNIKSQTKMSYPIRKMEISLSFRLDYPAGE